MLFRVKWCVAARVCCFSVSPSRDTGFLLGKGVSLRGEAEGKGNEEAKAKEKEKQKEKQKGMRNEKKNGKGMEKEWKRNV